MKSVQADNRTTNKFIYSIIDKHARWLINRESSKIRLMKMDYLFQTLKCVKVVEVPATDDCCGLRTKCKVWRTEQKVPALYEDSDGVILKSVYSVDGSMEFTPIKIQEYMRKLENPHSRYDKSRYFYYNNGYLYFPNVDIKMIQVKGYFVDDVINQCDPNCKEKECKSKLDNEFRIPPRLIGELMNFAFQDLVNSKKVPNDVQIDKNEARTQ